jgi:electron transport complex protein RnfG
MKNYIIFGLILFFVVTLCCGIVMAINSVTAPMIAENRRMAEENARVAVFPEAHHFQKVIYPQMTYYMAFDEMDNMLGFTFIASRFGYCSEIQTMVGLNADMTINRIAILSQAETPGLGTKCEEPGFLAKFLGLSKGDLRVDKDGGKIASITGATITTRAITRSIKDQIEILEMILYENNLHEAHQ